MKGSNLRKRPAATVNLVGGRICLDFVNSVGARHTGDNGEMVIRDEKLHDFLDLLAWAEHAQVLNPTETKALERETVRHPSEAGRVFRLAIRLRESLYPVFRTIVKGGRVEQTDLAVLNEEIPLALAAQRIEATSQGFRWAWSHTRPSFEKILWIISESAAELLTSADPSRLRQCGGDDCGWIFEDMTRNRSRYWCDMRDCGNRDRVRRFRARQKQRRTQHLKRTAPAR